MPTEPAPAAASSCDERAERATSYRVTTRAGRYRWNVDGSEVASAGWRDHCWDLRDGNGEVVMCLTGGFDGGRSAVAMVDHVTGTTGTFAPAQPISRSQLGALVDGSGRVRVLARGDGPTGVHLIDSDGYVLALVSRRRRGDGHGADVLVTPAGSAHSSRQLLGVTLALELLRSGAVRNVA